MLRMCALHAFALLLLFGALGRFLYVRLSPYLKLSDSERAES